VDLISSLGDVLPEGAAVAGGGLEVEDGFLFAEEEALVLETVPKRQQEFLAGRSYARRALSWLGCTPGPILVEPSRTPQWPTGFTGTISHSTSFCAAIAARVWDVASIGLDIEDDRPLDDEVVPLVCREADLEGRVRIERSIDADLPKLVFVAKEAFYKAYFPLTGCFLDFADVEMAIDPGSSVFEARLVNMARPSFDGQRQLSGRFGHIGTTMFAVAVLPQAVVPAKRRGP
jgi:4'-phosphopantetheinyl transferase EntD